jgi:pimeloyl-ACP methyl ester carboxylesterase
MMQKEIYIGNKKIVYQVSGQGSTVVLVHGFGEAGEIWKNQVAFLADRFQLIVPDLPGSGRSELIEDMSMEGMAEAIKMILDNETRGEQAEVCMIGHSMGGYITLAFAEKYEDRLNSFGLFHSTAYADSEEKKATRRKGIEFIKGHGSFEFLKTAIPNLFSADSRSQMPNSIEELVDQGHNFSAEALVSYYVSMIKRPDRTDVLTKVKKPVLFVLGKYDTAIPLEDALKQCHLPERSYINILHCSGHMGMLEETEKSNRLLVQFIDELNSSY